MRTVVKGPKVTWVDIQNPTQKDVEFLRETYSLHPVILKEIIPPSWRAKVEVFPSYLFLVLHHPVYSKATKKTRPKELDIIVTKDTLITIHYEAILPLKALLDRCNLYAESKKSYMGQTSGHLLYYLLDRFWEDCLIKISRINTKITNIEEQIFEGKESDMVKNISLTRTDILDFSRIITPQEDILQSLNDVGVNFFAEDTKHYFSNIIGKYTKCKNELETQKETVGALEETNNSLLNKKINEIIKVLTIFSVIVFPLTLFAGIFGMNTKYLPFVGQPNDFWIISGIMLIGIVTMILLFKKKRWL
ncbi:MAG: magnesium transporter CorA family protein [Patescibacteria group bacterium]|nr:magnesium transporter CorA family protein [Patescibacteria group bacterium]